MIIFISYSRKDREVARTIDSSLLANGVETFLDERDILVGESFPDRIYQSIESASHLIYIVSAQSLASRWVQEELAIAKVREKEEKGYKILPVLIEDIALPVSIKHLQYADFRNWRDQDEYRRAFISLLRGIGAKSRIAGGEDLAWYAEHSGIIRGIHSALHRIYGQIEGGFAASFAAPGSFYMAVKWTFEEDRVLRLLNQLEIILKEDDLSDRLQALKNSVTEAIDFGGDELSTRSEWKDDKKVHRFWKLIGRVSSMLDEFRGEVEIALLRGIELKPRKHSGNAPS